MSEHTKGPWSVWHHTEIPIVTDDATAQHISYMPSAHPVHEANAHLIAASPDLMAACEALLNPDIPDCDDDGCYLCEAKRLARIALAKAKGEDA